MLIGLLGNGALYAPLIVYVSRWFDRRRGTALALISSGQYIAGMIWPSVLEAGMKHFGWQPVMLGYGAVVLAILPLLTLLRPPPEALAPRLVRRVRGLVTGCWDCIAMWHGADLHRQLLLLHPDGHSSLASGRVLWRCRDQASHGAAMLSVMLACAFISRQFWGAFADHSVGCAR